MRYQDVFATTVDFLATIPFLVLIPYLVAVSFRGLELSERFRLIVIIGGWVWLAYAYASDSILFWLGTPPMDVVGHHHWSQYIAQQIHLGNWNAVRNHLNFGNDLYQVYVGFIYAFLGLSVRFVIMLNAFVAFSAGLVLVSGFRSIFPRGSSTPLWGIIIIFFPSIVFWTTGNSKEALMYWSICRVFSFVLSYDRNRSPFPGLFTCIAVVVGLLLRPHIMGCWLTAILLVAVVKFRKLAHALLLVPFLALAVTGAERLTGLETGSVEGIVSYGEHMHENLQRERNQGSTILYEGGQPAMVVSGAVSLLFRPFPWNIENLRTGLNALEAWALTLVICWSWIRAKNVRLEILKLPPVLVSLCVCLGFAFFFTFISNVGLLVRQKIQVMPALFALAILPAFHYAWSQGRTALAKPDSLRITSMEVLGDGREQSCL